MKKRIFVTLLALVMALGLTVTAAADDPVTGVEYVDADGTTKTCTEYEVVEDSGGSVTWDAGWYVVKDNVTIGNSSPNYGYVTVTGDVHLILCDNATLTVNGCFVASDNRIYSIHLASDTSTLTVYGQSAGTGAGTLDVSRAGLDYYPHHSTINPDVSTGIDLNDGSLTINGGHVKAGSQITVGYNYGLYNGALIMNGGTLTATSRFYSGASGHSAPIDIEKTTLHSDCCKWRTRYDVEYTAGSNIPQNPTNPYHYPLVTLPGFGNEQFRYLEIVAGHEFDTVVQANPATCTTDGNRGHLKCSLCGKETDAAGVEITADENLTIPATGHQFVGRICAVCGYEQPGHEPIRRQHVAAVEDTTTTTETKADEAKTDTVTSAKTFDVGVAVYGAMAVASLLGMGYVGKKRV